MAQETILVGDVLCESTGEPVANANIYYQGTKIGTSSNEDGSFALRTEMSKRKTLVISAVGYHTQRYSIEPGTMAGMQVALKERTAVLEEVLALPGANAALPILAQVRAHRSQNDRTLLGTTSEVSARTQLFVSHITKRQLRRQLWRSMQAGMIQQDDSSYLLPLYESVEKVQLVGNTQEPSGAKEERALILTENDYSELLNQDGNLNFYQNTVNLMGRSFLSPLASSGTLYYAYYLADSASTDDGKVYEIHYKTRNPFYATFNGSLWVDSATYAITALSAEVPAQTSVNYLSSLHINQSYASDHSLAHEDISTLLDFAIKSDTTHIFPTVLIRHILQSDQEPSMAVSSVVSADTTNIVSSSMDQLENVPAFRVARWLGTIITTGYIPTGTCVDIGHIEEILQVNEHETVHVGLPLRTNEKLWKNVSLEASIGYGWRDQALKGMGRVSVNLPTLRRNILQLEYQDHYVWSEVDDFSKLLRENSMGWKTMDFTAYAFEALHSNRSTINTATRQRQIQFWTENDWSDHVETNLYARVGWMGYGDPLVGYHAIPCYSYQSLGGIVRIGWGERKIDGYFRRVHVYSQYPVIYAGLEVGSWEMNGIDDPAISNGYHMYAKLNLLVRQNVSLGMGGALDWALMAGCIFGRVPYPMLHHFEGNQGYAYDPYRFTLMNNYQMAAQRYISLHTEWNGQGILFNLIPGIRYLRLRELVELKLAYGVLEENNRVLSSAMYDQAPARGGLYSEIGIGIGNILRVADLYSVWRLTGLGDNATPEEKATPRWALRFRIHLSL